MKLDKTISKFKLSFSPIRGLKLFELDSTYVTENLYDIYCLKQGKITYSVYFYCFTNNFNEQFIKALNFIKNNYKLTYFEDEKINIYIDNYTNNDKMIEGFYNNNIINN